MFAHASELIDCFYANIEHWTAVKTYFVIFSLELYVRRCHFGDLAQAAEDTSRLVGQLGFNVTKQLWLWALQIILIPWGLFNVHQSINSMFIVMSVVSVAGTRNKYLHLPASTDGCKVSCQNSFSLVLYFSLLFCRFITNMVQAAPSGTTTSGLSLAITAPVEDCVTTLPEGGEVIFQKPRQEQKRKRNTSVTVSRKSWEAPQICVGRECWGWSVCKECCGGAEENVGPQKNEDEGCHF